MSHNMPFNEQIMRGGITLGERFVYRSGRRDLNAFNTKDQAKANT